MQNKYGDTLFYGAAFGRGAFADDGLVVKRMREEDDGWAMTSDNSAFPSRRAGETDRVVGRLAWSGPLRLIEAHAGDPR